MSARRSGQLGGVKSASACGREAALQARWAAGEWRGRTLRATTGEAYQILYQGRPGGGAGPDFRDAVLLANGERIYGDVELHLRPSGWQAHGHGADARYNDLALHVVLDAGRNRLESADLAPTKLANGRHAPLVVLQPSPAPSAPSAPSAQPTPRFPYRHVAPRQPKPPKSPKPPMQPAALTPPRWPCADLTARSGPAARHALLLAAGQARFEQRAARFAADLRSMLGAHPAMPRGTPQAEITPQQNHLRMFSHATVAAPSALSNLWPNRRLPLPPPTAPPIVAPVAQTVHYQSPPDPGWSAADHILWLALAEALGYGRDRAALRAYGERLTASLAMCGTAERGQANAIAQVELDRVERLRLRGLLAWCERWATSGPWAPIHRALVMAGADTDAQTVVGGANDDANAAVRFHMGAGVGGGEDRVSPQADVGLAARRLLAALRVGGGGVSAGRAVILAANVALPFAAACASVTGDAALGALARRVYVALPGAPSNQITREMARQLGLPRAPDGAAAQQGLHHLWAAHCREKRCDRCPCNSASPHALQPAQAGFVAVGP